jgi:hypothetical protein
MKDRGVSVKVSSDFYRMMERTRMNLKSKGINVKSHVKLTQAWSKTPKVWDTRSLVRGFKSYGY